MASTQYDALILVDPRFMGGTATAVETDVRAMEAAGLAVGLHFVTGHDFFLPHETINPRLAALLDLSGVQRAPCDRTTRARIAFFHHPQPFQRGVDNPIQVIADNTVIVCHQAPFKGDGALEYDPFMIQRQIRNQFGTLPTWAPISGICRAQLRSFSPLLRLTHEDWPNTFQVGDWTPKREKLTIPHLVVGRHGRPHTDKWGDDRTDIAASLPAGPLTRIRTMGADKDFFEALGVETTNWDILPFNAEPVPDFLDSLDVFSYFHSSTWIETFGRTVAEAMLMGARCVLQPELKRTFGSHALYCEPSDVAQVLNAIRNDLHGARQATRQAREWCINNYAAEFIPARFEALTRDPGTTSRRGPITASPFTAARKWTGFHRRSHQARKQ